VQVLKETLIEDFKLLLKDFYLRFATPEELKREQHEHQKPKRYFNASKQADESSTKPKKQNVQKDTEQEAPPKKKRLIKSSALKALN